MADNVSRLIRSRSRILALCFWFMGKSLIDRLQKRLALHGCVNHNAILLFDLLELRSLLIEHNRKQGRRVIASAAYPDLVTDWNFAALNAIRANRTPTPTASRARSFELVFHTSPG